MANPRRRSRALCHSGAGGWPVGLPEKNFRVTAKASATASLALASVVLALGGGRTGFPKQVSERCKAEGSWTASGRNGRFINQKRTNGQISKFGLQMADFILSRIRRLSAVKPSHFYQGLAELQLYQGRAAAAAVLSSLGGRVARARFRNFGAGSWPVACRNNFPGDGRASATAMANPRRRSRALRCSGAGGWSVGLPETIFPTASLALASVVLALGGGRTGFPKRASKAEGSWTASGRNGRFINQKRTSGQISKFGLQMADFILSRIRRLSAVKPSHFYPGLAEWQLYQGRPAAMAVYQSRWQLCQGRPAYGRFIKNGRCVKIEDQASGRNGRFINQKRANGQICRFGLRMVDFILSRTSSLSTARSKASCSFFASCAAPLESTL